MKTCNRIVMAFVMLLLFCGEAWGSKAVIRREVLGKEGIPCLVACIAKAKGAPVVFLHHGFGGNKENFRQIATDLAGRGYFVIVPDAGWHGERIGSGGPRPSMLQIIMNSVREEASLIEGLKGDDRADPNRVGVVGFSMGGMTALAVPLATKGIKAAVAWCGPPDWSLYSGWGGPESERIAQNNSPLTHAEGYYPCALLMQFGSLDSGTPSYSGEELAKALRKGAYRKEPDKVKVVVHPGVGHTVSPAMEEAARVWFGKYLK